MTATTASSSPVLVKKSIAVAAAPERAFSVFTQQMSAWWPLASHHIGAVDAREAIIEPRVGGRWYEKGVDGSECLWGHVAAWDPPSRLVLVWEISADWKHDAKLRTEVEVRFTKEGNGTRVDLEHRLLENFGPRALEMKGIFDSEGGWNGMLAAFGAHVDRS
ncbi:MAG: SRPBCC family protein [Polyangiales bacterium]